MRTASRLRAVYTTGTRADNGVDLSQAAPGTTTGAAVRDRGPRTERPTGAA